MIVPDYRNFQQSNELYHYGMPRRSGRYPWGSGERPYQSRTIAGHIAEKVKNAYDKIPSGVKTAGKIGGKVAASILISNALGVVGGKIVYDALAPEIPIINGVGQITGWDNILKAGKQFDAARDASLKTYAGITTALSLGTIGNIKINPSKKDKK